MAVGGTSISCLFRANPRRWRRLIRSRFLPCRYARSGKIKAGVAEDTDMVGEYWGLREQA